MKAPRVLARCTAHQNDFVVVHDDELLFDERDVRSYVWVSHRSVTGSVVIPVLPGGDVVLVETYRHPTAEWSLELPAGQAEPDETPLDTACRELAEETGLRADTIVELGSLRPDPGVQSIEAFVFRAELCQGWNPEYADSGERIRRVTRVSRAVLDGLVRSGEISSGPSLAALFIEAAASGSH